MRRLDVRKELLGIGWRWVSMLLCCILCLIGCQAVEPGVPDVVPPHTLALPAGGIYPALPSQIRLLTEADATIYYYWNNESEQQYTGRIAIPRQPSQQMTLHFWAQDRAGNREPLRREHYVLQPDVAPVEMLDLDRPELGPTDTAMLRWRSMANAGTYEIAVTQSGWGTGRLLAEGRFEPGVEQQTPLAAKMLFPGENRLWLRVRNAAAQVGATSRLITRHVRAPTTRAWPGGGVFGAPQTVHLLSERPATIYYTTDGSEPTPDAIRYTDPIRIEQMTQLRYFSVDAYGNRESPQQGEYDVRRQAPSITLLTLSGYVLPSATPLTFTWRSDTAGRYSVLLTHPRQRREITVQQGEVRRKQEVQSSIATNFFSFGDWRVQIRVTPDHGEAGELSFSVRVPYREAFTDSRFLASDATSANWDAAQSHVRLGRGPHLLATYDTRSRSRQVMLHGQHAYLANGKGGLHIVEVAEPQRPRRVGVFYPHGKPVAVAKQGHYAYLAAGASGISVLDVSRPASPTLVATLSLPGGVTDVNIAPPLMYVGTKRGVLYIFDLSTPLQPRPVGQVTVEGPIIDIGVADGVAYLACLSHGVNIVDVRTPSQPRLVGHWPTRKAATGIALQRQRAYVAAGDLEVLDIQRPEAPVLRRSVRMSGAYGAALWPPHALVAAGTDGIHAVPINGSDFKYQSFPTAHYAARFAMTDNHLLVADTRGGLRLFDMSQPDRPRLLSVLDDIGAIVDVAVDGTLAYLADDRYGSGLVVVDLSSPTAPRVVGRYHNELTTDVVVKGDLALVSDAAGVLQVVDAKRPSRPKLLSSLKLPGKPHRVVFLPPSYALIASDAAGVHVVDIRQPAAPMLVTTVSIDGRALDLAVANGVAYVAAAQGGIEAIDLQIPSQPKRLVTYHHQDGEGDRIIRLIVDGQTVYAIDGGRGLQILAMTGNGSLQLRGQANIPKGAPWALTTVGPYVFVTTLLNALYVFDATNLSQPHLISTAPYGGAGIIADGRHLYIAVRGSRGTPGGLRIVEAFAAVSEAEMRALRRLGIASMAGERPDQLVVNRAYVFNTPGVVQSTGLSFADGAVREALLRVEDFWPRQGRIDYSLSNDGGATWQTALPGQPIRFAKAGADLRWRAALRSAVPTLTPLLQVIWVDAVTETD